MAHAATSSAASADDRETPARSREAVDTTAGEPERWLATPESRDAGWRAREGDAKPVGHDLPRA